MSRGAREAKNELKAGLFESDSTVLSTMPKPVTVFCLGVVYASGMKESKTEKRFP